MEKLEIRVRQSFAGVCVFLTCLRPVAAGPPRWVLRLSCTNTVDLDRDQWSWPGSRRQLPADTDSTATPDTPSGQRNDKRLPHLTHNWEFLWSFYFSKHLEISKVQWNSDKSLLFCLAHLSSEGKAACGLAALHKCPGWKQNLKKRKKTCACSAMELKSKQTPSCRFCSSPSHTNTGRHTTKPDPHNPVLHVASLVTWPSNRKLALRSGNSSRLLHTMQRMAVGIKEIPTQCRHLDTHICFVVWHSAELVSGWVTMENISSQHTLPKINTERIGYLVWCYQAILLCVVILFASPTK